MVSVRPASLALVVLLSIVSMVACSSPEKSEVKVAEIEDRVITLEYFEHKMNNMDPQFLPANINTRDGRLDLLEIMINKEVMAIKAEELGFAEDGSADQQAKAVADFAAVADMRRAVRGEAIEVSEEEIIDYYDNFARALKISYMLFDWESDAVEARRLVDGGEDWRAVGDRLSLGSQDGQYTNTLRYGTVVDDFELVVFDLAVGEVSQPIETSYGYFVVRVDGQEMERVRPLDEMREEVMASIRKRKDALLTKQFILGMFEDYNFELDLDAMRVVWEALPPDAPLDPPTPREELLPLNLAPANMDMELMRYHDQAWTLRRYFDYYNELSVFGRPRQDRRVAGLRRHLQEIAIREMLPVAAKDRGFMDSVAYLDQFKNRREESLVTRLHEEMVRDQIRISPEELKAYWEEIKDEFFVHEHRRAEALIASTEQEALAAREKALNGEAWGDLLAMYGTPGEVLQKKGDMGTFSAETEHTHSVYHEMVFSLENEGEITFPREVQPGQWLIVRCAELNEGRQPSYEQVQLPVGNRLKGEREEALFKQRVEEWKSGMFIRRYPDALDKAIFEPTAPVGEELDRLFGNSPS